MQIIPGDGTGFKKRSGWIQQQGSLREGVHRYEILTLVSYTLNFVTEEQAMFQLHSHLKFDDTAQPVHNKQCQIDSGQAISS